MTDRDFWLGFSLSPGIGPKKFNLLIRNFGSAEKAWSASESELEPILKPALTSKFLGFRQYFDFEKYLQQLKRQKISFICLSDKEYPALLKKIPNPPIVLYVKALRQVQGKVLDLNDFQPAIAVVGTRHITSYGRQITEMFTQDLARAGLIIVSGMALGVDGVAHQSAIEAKGKTIAVLGNGVDIPYPRENEKLYEEIIDSGGAVISEFPPGMPASVGSFPSRNRIVAGLSLGVLVTEGASDSGSLITANLGLDFGRKVFAVPGPITSNLSKAPLDLIRKGARLVTSAEDILRELQITNYELGISPTSPSLRAGKAGLRGIKGLNKDEQKILRLLENEGFNFDEIARKTKIDSSKLAGILSMMEIKGMIKNSEGKFFIGA